MEKKQETGFLVLYHLPLISRLQTPDFMIFERIKRLFLITYYSLSGGEGTRILSDTLWGKENTVTLNSIFQLIELKIESKDLEYCMNNPQANNQRTWNIVRIRHYRTHNTFDLRGQDHREVKKWKVKVTEVIIINQGWRQMKSTNSCFDNESTGDADMR